jgi:hypothetical protein
LTVLVERAVTKRAKRREFDVSLSSVVILFVVLFEPLNLLRDFTKFRINFLPLETVQISIYCIEAKDPIPTDTDHLVSIELLCFAVKCNPLRSSSRQYCYWQQCNKLSSHKGFDPEVGQMELELNTTTDKHFETFQIIPLRPHIQPQNNK